MLPLMVAGKTRAFWRNELPHWEVEAGTYFMTVRCSGTLPEEALAKVAEIHRTLREIEPHSDRFAQLQRRYFLITEKYLDRGEGFCPFHDAGCCRVVIEALEKLRHDGWHLRHYVVMPNHLHALLDTTRDASGMKRVWSSWKGRTARACNQILHRSGRFWQRDWFDRWMRDPAAHQTIAYIRNNPVKAGLVEHWEDYPWVR